LKICKGGRGHSRAETRDKMDREPGKMALFYGVVGRREIRKRISIPPNILQKQNFTEAGETKQGMGSGNFRLLTPPQLTCHKRQALISCMPCN